MKTRTKKPKFMNPLKLNQLVRKNRIFEEDGKLKVETDIREGYENISSYKQSKIWENCIENGYNHTLLGYEFSVERFYGFTEYFRVVDVTYVKNKFNGVTFQKLGHHQIEFDRIQFILNYFDGLNGMTIPGNWYWVKSKEHLLELIQSEESVEILYDSALNANLVGVNQFQGWERFKSMYVVPTTYNRNRNLELLLD